ncbi:MAG: hypothetical protein M1829_006874 [Trizodia sp. TS-e1964]|nr:MAG: hypothetical protein M1829_006874 [Trizodia sp. TS-e1964]
MAHPPSESHELLDESCLDFLVHELGLEIPRTYRYAQGIHEVQKRLILRYGDENIARVMDIFNSLLEDENNAAGLGDDGDVWRSWRHDYKMRGTDFANPGTPRFPGIILPPSGRQSGGRVNNPSQSTHGGDVGLLGRPDMSFGSSNLEPSSPSLDRGGDIREIGQDLIIKDLQLKKRNTLRKRISHRLLAILPLTKGKQHVPPPITDQNGQPQSSRPLLYNLDGACDEPDECASPHLVRNFSPTLQSPHSPSRSEMHSFDVSTRSPTHDSGASSELSSAKYESTVSSKDGFRSLTRDLIAPERVSAEGSTASSGLYGDFRPLDPPKFNPSSPVARRSSELPDQSV